MAGRFLHSRPRCAKNETIVASRIRLGVAVLTLASCLLGGRALAGESIVLQPLELSGTLEVSRADLEAAVQRGLAVAGRPVVGPGERGTYVVSGSVARDGTTFRVTFRLVRSADRSVLNTQQSHCDVADCSLAEMTRRSARELVRQTLGRPNEAPVATAVAPAPTVITTPPEPPPPPPSRSKLWPALGLGAGAAAIGTGVFLIVIDDRCTSDPPGPNTCRNLNDTRTGGLIAIAGGTALAAVSAYFLLFDGGDTQVSLSPRGVAISGKF